MKGISIYLCLITMLLPLGAGTTILGQETTTGGVSNSFVGIWVMNPEKSFTGFMKSSIYKIEAQDNRFKLTFDWVNAEGKSTHWVSSPKFDGMLYPIIGFPDRTYSIRRINANSFELARKRFQGEPIRHEVVVLSEDGKTLNVTARLKGLKGEEITRIFVYDRKED